MLSKVLRQTRDKAKMFTENCKYVHKCFYTILFLNKRATLALYRSPGIKLELRFQRRRFFKDVPMKQEGHDGP